MKFAILFFSIFILIFIFNKNKVSEKIPAPLVKQDIQLFFNQDSVFWENGDTLIDYFASSHYEPNKWKFILKDNVDYHQFLIKNFNNPYKISNDECYFQYYWKLDLKKFNLPIVDFNVSVSKNDSVVYLSFKNGNYNYLIQDSSYIIPLNTHFDSIFKPIIHFEEESNSDLGIYPSNYYNYTYSDSFKFEGKIAPNGALTYNEQNFSETENSIIKNWKFPIMIKNKNAIEYSVKIDNFEFERSSKYISPIFKEKYIDLSTFEKLNPEGLNKVKYSKDIYFFYIREKGKMKKIINYKEYRYLNNSLFYLDKIVFDGSYSEDINGDGKNDIRMYKYSRGIDRAIPIYDFFIYNPKTEEYDYHPEIYSTFEFNKDKKCFVYFNNPNCIDIIWNGKRFMYTKKYRIFVIGSYEYKIESFLENGQVKSKKYYKSKSKYSYEENEIKQIPTEYLPITESEFNRINLNSNKHNGHCIY